MEQELLDIIFHLCYNVSVKIMIYRGERNVSEAAPDRDGLVPETP